MLEISKDQMTKMSVNVLLAFKVQLKDHIREYYPIQSAPLDDECLFTLIDDCLETAQDLSISEQAAIQSFVDHCILLGKDFHQNPLYFELCRPLYDSDINDNIYRLDKLYDSAWAYLEVIRGQDASKLFLAVSRLKSWLQSAKALQYNSLNLQEILSAFQLVYPEKYEAHSQKLHIDFIKQTVKRANADDFLQPASQLAYVLMAFIAGIGFYRDQLYIGVLKEHIEALSTALDQNTRYEVLLHGANIYLSNIIKSAKALATEH